MYCIMHSFFNFFFSLRLPKMLLSLDTPLLAVSVTVLDPPPRPIAIMCSLPAN